MTMAGKIRWVWLVLALLVAQGLACSGNLVERGPSAEPRAGSEQPSPGAASPVDSRPDPDPWEPMNRKIFWFNDKADVWVLEPVARAWDTVAPDPVQRSVSNFFHNVRFPIVLANDLLQGKVRDAGNDVGRFAVNTTIGVGGLFDPATGFGLERKIEDFGQTLATWGSPSGPYLVLPLLGPSNVRDMAGLLVDIPLSVTPFFVNEYILLGAQVGDTVNERSLFLDEVEEAKEAALDYYVFVRNAYGQRRQALIQDEDPEVSRKDEQDLYFPEEE